MSPHPSLHHITLHLARSQAFPYGSTRHGYEIVAPLTADHHLDAPVWTAHREQCLVRRFWAGEPDRFGKLVHRAGGAGGATWLIDYDDAITDDDEPGYRLDTHSFIVGEYVTIRDAHGGHTFRVVGVDHRPLSHGPGEHGRPVHLSAG